MGSAATDAAAFFTTTGAKRTKLLVFLRMINKKREGGSQKATAEAANLLEATGPSEIKPSGTLKICLEVDNELQTAGLSTDEAEENEDAKFARLLQEHYWKSMKQKKNKSPFYHPEAVVFINNYNVTSRGVMDTCGDMDDCISTTDAAELAAALDENVKSDLPLPGQVELFNGGPSYGGVSFFFVFLLV